jgi:hypothetical protein
MTKTEVVLEENFVCRSLRKLLSLEREKEKERERKREREREREKKREKKSHFNKPADAT